MRDVHRMREGIELQLNNKQIASFVICSLVVLAVVFSLGVVMGKQLAATNQPVPTRAAGDSLAAIDAKEKVRTQESVEGTGEIPQPKADPALTFQSELTKPKAANPIIEPTKPAAKEKVEKAEKPKEAKAEPAADEAKEAKADPEAVAKKPEEPKKPSLAAAFDKVSGKKEGGDYSLQVSSLPTRAEADKLIAKLESKGVTAYVVEADVVGKRMYRVRVGSFASRADAEDALKSFKSKTGEKAIIASK